MLCNISAYPTLSMNNASHTIPENTPNTQNMLHDKPVRACAQPLNEIAYTA